MHLSLIQRISFFFKETGDFSRLLDESTKKIRTVVFYSERDIYFQYYEGLINAIIKNSDLDICYITSDPTDPQLKTTNPRIKPFYIRNSLVSLFARLGAKVLVMTMTDLDNFHIKKPPYVKNCIYVFHAISSTHLGYSYGAFDHYDTVFCVGPHHISELKKAEEIFKTKPKTLIECGYHRLERIYEDHQRLMLAQEPKKRDRKIILIAPTWGNSCILETCICEVIDVLEGTEYDVYIRPHPEFIKRRESIVAAMEKRVKKSKNIRMELDLVSDINIHNADVLITDYSGIAFEYAFGTERPVLFINTPLKADNPRYKELEIEPVDLVLRNLTGVSVNMDEIPGIVPIISSFIKEYPDYQKRIIKCRKSHIFNWMSSAEAGARYIIDYCKEQ